MTRSMVPFMALSAPMTVSISAGQQHPVYGGLMSGTASSGRSRRQVVRELLARPPMPRTVMGALGTAAGTALYTPTTGCSPADVAPFGKSTLAADPRA
jgi:hypothetical protein